MVPRVDVFSAKGGVGKTTLSFCLADAQAQHTGAPVLLVDADLTGTCVGDLLQPWAVPRWHSQHNLVHLVCGPPERLDDILREDDKLPVYDHSAVPPLGFGVTRAPEGATGPKIFFCPSHLGSKLPESAGRRPVSRAVLHALLGHESAGGWVNHVIRQLVEAMQRRVPSLAAVIVDHGPGIGALQQATLDAIRDWPRKSEAGAPPWRALVVTTRDGVDLAAISDLEVQLGELREQLAWVINRVPRAAEGPDWRDAVANELHEALRPEADWFHQRAWPVHHSEELAGAYSKSALHGVTAAMKSSLAPLRSELFGK